MQTFFIPSSQGHLEATYDTPRTVLHDDITVVICHPHPLFDGTMYNKVVSTIGRAFKDAGIQALRFNYRGVMNSSGHYGEGVGELEDLLAVVKYVRQAKPRQKIILAGFSFGGSVAYKGLSHCDNVIGLITVAPAVVNFPLIDFSEPQVPWLVVQGIDDDTVSAEAVFDFVIKQTQAQATIVKFNGVGHFFHGRLMDLKKTVEAFIPSMVEV